MFRPPDIPPTDSFWSQERILEREAITAREREEFAEQWRELKTRRRAKNMGGHNPFKPAALWSRLKARAARVSWDSWG